MITRRALCLFLSFMAFYAGITGVSAQTEGEWRRGLRDLNTSYFPMAPVADAAAWKTRKEEIKNRILLAAGLLPLPEKTPLNAVIHGRVERDDYTIDRVFFESLPGHHVCGSLYLPKKIPEKMPGILCPHGHWPDGRFMDLGAGSAAAKKQIETQAEELECAARSPLQARCVQLARMGCAVFHYDMVGYADSAQFCDREGKPRHRHGALPEMSGAEKGTWGFVSPQADLRLQGYFGLQTWNSVRALDFLLTVPGVDAARLGCTGASGGGTQTMVLAAIDERIAASFPCVMVSTAMQGGCTCENSHHLRINQGNIDIAAAAAPRPQGLTAADDWTKELEAKGLPELKAHYAMLGAPGNLTAHIATQFPHNYNLPSRLAMYHFFNQHFKLGLKDKIAEREFTVSSKEELTVWTAEHPAPAGDKAGDMHEKAVCAWMTQQDERNIRALITAKDEESRKKARDIVGTAWELLIGRGLPKAEEVAFELGEKEDRGGHFFLDGMTKHTAANEGIACEFLYPKQWNGTTVLWVSLKADDLFTDGGDHAPSPAVLKLLEAGIAIAHPALYQSTAGVHPKVGCGVKAKPGEFGEYAGYYYGYNPSLMAQRVRDVLTLITMMKSHTDKPSKRIYIAGTSGAAEVALAGAALSKTVIDGVASDLDGFRFEKLTSAWDSRFMPGAVKYGDVEGLIALCDPLPVNSGKGAEGLADALVRMAK